MPELLPTGQVFAIGTPVYMRYSDIISGQKMVLVDCLGLQGSSTVMSVEWGVAALLVSNPPPLGSRVLCYTIVGGVLYTVAGRIAGQVAGASLRLDLVVEDHCHGVSLRRHTRFTAKGELTLQKPGSGQPPSKLVPRVLDLSPGGLGAVLPDCGWQAGDRLNFTLSFIPEQTPGSKVEFSKLEISGQLAVRKCKEQTEPGLIRLGCEFIELPELDQRLLKLLITAHGAALRAS